MKIIDNFLPKAYEDSIEDSFFSPSFPWFFAKNTITEDYARAKYFSTENVVDTPQFFHSFLENYIPNSSLCSFILPVLHHLMLAENIRTDKPLRIKANMNNQYREASNKTHYTIHTDAVMARKENEFITCIYYVNDCDGDTIFFTKEGSKEINRVTPKKGRLVYFDGMLPHAGQAPKNSYARCVLNINLDMRGLNELT